MGRVLPVGTHRKQGAPFFEIDDALGTGHRATQALPESGEQLVHISDGADDVIAWAELATSALAVARV